MTKEEMLEISNKEILNKNGFIKHNGYKITDIGDNYCEMEANISDDSLNPFGIAHGGFIFGLADTAAGTAIRTTGKFAVTTEASINYINPSRGSKLIAKTNCLKIGSSIATYEVFIYDENELLTAKATLSYYFIKKD